jgi:hypothetical protein
MTRTASVATSLAVFVIASIAGLSITGTAAAKGTKCGEQIVADWFDNGRIDRLYPLHCYEEAIDAIPKDIRDYADAADVINRALQAALNGKLDQKGGPDPTPGKTRKIGAGNGGDNDKTGNGNPTATGAIDTSGPSSVPIPLLVLGGISLALLAAGGYGYVSRRRRLGDDVDHGPLSG